jgi:hypothetical protein
MTIDVNGSSGTPSDITSGESIDGQGTQAPKDIVSYETHRKLLNEKKKAQEEIQALKATLDEKNKRERESLEKEMRDKEEWKKLVEIRENELKETKTKLENFETGLRDSKKASAFLGELAKRGVSVRQSYYDLINVENILVDPSTSEIDPASVKKYADAWITEHYELAKATNPGVKLPMNAPQGGSQLTYEEWLKLPVSDMKSRYHEIRQVK